MPVDDPDQFGARDLLEIMHDLYPAVEDERSDELPYEHPMTAVGIVLLSAAMMGSVDIAVLTSFTGCSTGFIAAIAFNMTNNGLWANGRYDTSDWLPRDSGIQVEELWEHVEIACGNMWRPVGDDRDPLDPCKVFWDERDGFTAENGRLQSADKHTLAIREFWESMADFPDLDVVYDVLCAPCKRTGRRPGAFWLPCSECQMLIDLLRPPNAAGSHS